MNLDYLIQSLHINRNEYLVVGVSSGPDSMALLHLLKKNTANKIVCAHINHNIRTSSSEEEQYLKKYCYDNDIIFECFRINSYKEKNLENEARKYRYAFFEKTLKKYNSHSLFLAHHGDDLIETIIMKIIRGSNLEGYAGIKTYSKMDSYTIIRPFLSITKEDIIKYNNHYNIKYFIDTTNEDLKFTRNRIRKNILPILKNEDAKIHLKFLRYSKTIQEYYNYIEEITLNKINTDYKLNKINIRIFNKETEFEKKNIIFYILSNIYNNKDNIIKDKHIESIINLASSLNPNAIIYLPKGYYAKRNYDYIYINKENNKEKAQNYKILVNKAITINNFIIEKINNTEEDGNDICRLNSKDVKLPLYIRNKQQGDYIEVLGLNGKKKVSDIFIENKIPKEFRNTYPVLIDNNNTVLWIPNLKKSKYNVKKSELCDIILTCHKKGGN